MKIAPISADLLIKLSLAVAVAAGLFYAYKKATGAAGAAVDAVTEKAAEVADAVIVSVNPANPGNIINRGVSAAGSAITGQASWSLGAAAWEFFNPGAVAREKAAIGITTSAPPELYEWQGD